MKKILAKAAITMAMVLSASTILAGCGNDAQEAGGNDSQSSGTSQSEQKEGNPSGGTIEPGKDTQFDYLVMAAIGSNFIDSYNDNPAAKYWLNMEWDADGDGVGKKISVNFLHPTSGSEQDYITTLLSTGEYPDVVPLSFSSESALDLYEEGIALDITDYVQQYMPNYLAYIDAHPGFFNKVTNKIDGEARFIQLYSVNDEQVEPWGGLMYRRDWVVRYGTNPETGAAFTGEWVDNEWVDDVVFPSGNADPLYISDWEWMIKIMETAMEDMGITDGYIVQLPSSGAEGTGDLMTGFGGCGPLWYYVDDETIDYGTTSDGMRAYLECMNTWYNNGWVNKNFAENSNDMFFMVDMGSVYSGKVGIWYGMNSSLLGNLDSHSGEASDPLNGAVVYAAASPINDVYGDAAVQNTKPKVIYADSLIGQGMIITDKAKDKDIATLLTAIDYLYSTEGARLRTFGLSDKQMAEVQDPQYLEWGLEEGAYTLRENGDGTETVVKNPLLIEDTEGLDEASNFFRVGCMHIANSEKGYTEGMKDNLEIWKTYPNSGTIQSDLVGQLAAGDASAYGSTQTELMTAMAVWLPQFIDGTLDIHDDADWQSYCDEIESYNPGAVRDALQKALTGE